MTVECPLCARDDDYAKAEAGLREILGHEPAKNIIERMVAARRASRHEHHA